MIILVQHRIVSYSGQIDIVVLILKGTLYSTLVYTGYFH